MNKERINSMVQKDLQGNTWKIGINNNYYKVEESYYTEDFVKHLLEKIKILENANSNIDRAISYYYKVLAKYEKDYKNLPEELVEFYNILEGNK